MVGNKVEWIPLSGGVAARAMGTPSLGIGERPRMVTRERTRTRCMRKDEVNRKGGGADNLYVHCEAAAQLVSRVLPIDSVPGLR